MVMEGHLLSHKKILVKRVPYKVYIPNVLVMSISFLLQEYCLNHGSTGCLSNCLEWVDLSWRDLDQRELSCNLCDSKL